MKRLICLCILGLFFTKSYSQQIKEGTTFNYTFFLHGQTVPVEFSVSHLTDSLTLKWKIRGLANGTYTMLPSALQHGDRMNFVQPNVAVQLGDKETFLMISVDAFNKLVKNHQFVYDNTVYDFKNKDSIVGLDLLHVTAQNETTELWILNDAAFPLVCQIKGSPLGIDCLLNQMK